MDIRRNPSFSHFWQTLLIAPAIAVVLFVGTDAYVQAQIGGGDGDPIATGLSGGNSVSVDPVPGGPGFIMVGAFEFKPYSEAYSQAYSGALLYNPSSTTNTDSMAGLTLPHGATITKITLYFEDISTTNTFVYLLRAGADGVSNIVTSCASVGAQAGFRTASNQSAVLFPVVDNQNYSYFLELVIPSFAGTDIRISNVRIDYEYTANLPMIVN